MTRLVATISTAFLMCSATSSVAQTPAQRQQRYQIGVMERVLEQAVEHGAKLTRDRLQALVPAEMLLSGNARVRGFRIDSYGVFFDVEVPTLETSLPWMFRTLDRNDLGLDSALKTLRAVVEKTGDINIEQALKRIELQVAPASVGGPAPAVNAATTASRPGARALTGSPATTEPSAVSTQPADAILDNPEEAYRKQVTDALMDAMLDYSRGLDIASAEWLQIAARRQDDRPRLTPADTDARTVMIRVRGADLTEFLGGRISREEARKRMDVKVF